MSATLTTLLLGAAGVVAAMLAVLLPVILTQGKGLRRELDHLRGDVRALTARVGALAERVAHIEGAMSGPWRPPPNGNPAPAPPVAPSPEATP